MLLLVIYSILFVSCYSKSIGTVNNTRFTSIDLLNTGTIWLYNQTSPQQCLCTVLSKYNNTVLHFNSYSDGSCQLFLSLPYTYTMEYNINSTIIFLTPLPPVNQAPCCSDLAWLMTRLKNSSLPIVNINYPTHMVIDDLDYLAVVLYNDKLYRYNRTTMTYVTSTSIATNCMALSYYNKQYFVGCGAGATSKLYVLSTATLASITNITVPSDPRDAVFIRNGSVMIASVEGTTQLAFYNVTSPTSYTLTSTLSAPNTPYTLYRINDTLIYLATMTASTPIYTLTYADTTKNWTWNSIAGTKSTSSTYNFETIFDACGRMWISVKGYGIRIFDSTGSNSLYNWTLSTGLNSIVLAQEFDFYAADFLNSRIFSYRSGIDQCTS